MSKNEWITDRIVKMVETASENSLHLSTGEPAFGTPLVGFSMGDDPLYAFQNFGLKVNSCGLCQTGVPCESKIPVREALPGGDNVSNR